MSTDDELFANRYRLEDRLGVGGMSTVQLAFDTRLERYVAVKILAEHLAADPAFVSRFRREALAAARLVHPNVVQVYDFGHDDATDRNFIVMEHVEGESCAEILRERRSLPPAEAVAILTQACRGLDYAHRNGVVHRDVKPGNLLRNRDGVVKLADFGIAKAAEDSDITKVGSVLGTAAYLSPEQGRGEPAGPASDLYALGVVAYQLLAGRLPYEGTSLTELARQQESGPPESLDRVEPDVPPALAAAVARALSPSLETRYPDALAMEEALRDGLRGVAPAEAAPAAAATTAFADDPTDLTTAMGATEATHVAAPPPRRPLEPIAEAPAPRRAPAAPAPVARRRRGVSSVVLLVLILALLAGGAVVAYTSSNQTKHVQRCQIPSGGSLDDAFNALRDCVSTNTR